MGPWSIRRMAITATAGEQPACPPLHLGRLGDLAGDCAKPVQIRLSDLSRLLLPLEQRRGLDQLQQEWPTDPTSRMLDRQFMPVNLLVDMSPALLLERPIHRPQPRISQEIVERAAHRTAAPTGRVDRPVA